SSSGTSKATFVARGRAQGICLNPVDPLHSLQHQLSDSFTRLYYHGFVADIDHQHLNFTAVITVDRSRSVDDRKAPFKRQSAAWSHLDLKMFGDLKGKTC